MVSGTSIQGYAVGAKISDHVAGQLYQGEAPEAGQPVSILVLDSELAADVGVRQRLAREAPALLGLRHPGIIPVLAAETEGDHPALVLDPGGGFPLREVLERRKRLSFTEAVTVLPRILEAVEYAHLAGVVHWALSPGCIRMETDGGTRVADFGLARVLGKARFARPGAIADAILYMAPEQLQDLPDVDHRADVYSLGVLFYEALTGQVPFNGQSTMPPAELHAKVREAHLSQPPPDPQELRPALPESLVKILLRALAKEAAQRFQSAKELKLALDMVEWQRISPLVYAHAARRVKATAPRLETAPAPTARPRRSSGVEQRLKAQRKTATKPSSPAAAGTPPAFPVDTYRMVGQKFREAGEIDRAWCVSAVLRYLKQANAEELQFFEQYQASGGQQKARACLTDESWRRHLAHPDGDRFIDAVLGAIGPAVSSMMARPHKAFGLKPDDRRDLTTDQLLFSRVFRHVSWVLGVIQPDLYLKPDQQTGLLMAHTQETPSFVVGADMLRGRSEEELSFTIAWHLSYMRPEYFLCNVLQDPAKLKAVFYAALRRADPGLVVPGEDAEAVEQTAKAFKGKLPSAVTEHLGGLLQKVGTAATRADLTRWWATAELTANRVGLLLCNDLELAGQRIMTGVPTVGARPAAERLMDLLLFMVSDSYAALRQQLGLTVE